jgi:hypothetical protein
MKRVALLTGFEPWKLRLSVLLEFFIMQDNTLSTFSIKERDQMVAVGQQMAKVELITLTTVDQVISEYAGGVFPDFLSLDAEGLDFSILKSIAYDKHYPKIICVEAAEYSPRGGGERRSELLDFLTSKNYIEYANTNLNAIMVHEEFWAS